MGIATGLAMAAPAMLTGCANKAHDQGPSAAASPQQAKPGHAEPGHAEPGHAEPGHAEPGNPIAAKPARPASLPAPNQTAQNQAVPNQAAPSHAAPSQPGQNQPDQARASATVDEGAFVDLSPNLSPGTLARYSLRLEGQDINELTGSMAARSEARWDATLDVLVQFAQRTDAGIIPATISLDRVRATDAFDGRIATFDSGEPIDKDPGNLIRPSIEGLVGARIEIDLDTQGQIVAVRLPEALTRRHNPTTRWTTRLLRDAEVRLLFGPIFSTQVARGQGANDSASGHSSPAHRARVGDAWITTREEPFGSAGVTTTVTHALDQIDQASATISLNGTSVITPSERVAPGLQRVTRDAYSGTTRWDLSRGLLAEHELGLETQVQVRPDPEGFTISKTRLVQVRRVD